MTPLVGKIATLLGVLLGALAAWGIGHGVQRATRTSRDVGAASLGIGLAAVVCVGGILNLAHVAFAPALWSIGALGIGLGAFELRRRWAALRELVAAPGELALAATVIGATIGWAIVTQAPQRTFNIHDDFEKYFAQPVRMLQTGTLVGSTLSALGAETLGGQAFLQSFVLSVAPISYIQVVDGIFGLAILMVVASAAGWRRFGRFPGAVLGPLLVVVINPQCVNTSAIYLAATLMASAILLVLHGEEERGPSPLALGVIYAGVIALKSTFALFVAIHLPLAAAAVGSGRASTTKAIQWLLSTAAWTLAALSPWLLLYLPNYLAQGTLPPQLAPPGVPEVLRLFSTRGLTYGSSCLDFTLAALVAGAVAIAAGVSAWRSTDEREVYRSLAIAAGACTAPVAYFFLLGVGPRMGGYGGGLRYSIPFLLGALPVAIAVAPVMESRLPARLVRSGALGAAALLLACFAPSLGARLVHAAQYGSTLSFAKVAALPEFLAYNDASLADSARLRVRSFQDQVPQGEELVTQIETPFLLNYRRNDIIDVEPAGLCMPWARIPAGAHYLLWQYAGYAVRTEANYRELLTDAGAYNRLVAATSLAFGRYLSQLELTARIVAKDDQYILMDLS